MLKEDVEKETEKLRESERQLKEKLDQALAREREIILKKGVERHSS